METDWTLSRSEVMILPLCLKVFGHPETLCQCIAHRAPFTLSSRSHAHADLIQMDLCLHCDGQYVVGDQILPLSNISTVCIYPQEMHRLQVSATNSKGILYSLKLRAGADWANPQRRPFSRMSKLELGDNLLYKVLERLERLLSHPRPPVTFFCSLVSEFISLWPRAEGKQKEPHALFLRDDPKAESALAWIEKHLVESPTIDEIAFAVQLSPRQLMRRFRATYGTTLHRYIMRRLLQIAQKMLISQDDTITEIAEVLGFPSINTFSRWFKKMTGVSPSAYREKDNVHQPLMAPSESPRIKSRIQKKKSTIRGSETIV